MNTPRRAASRAAPATVFGMSWNLRSRKTSAPALLDASTAAGPAAVKSWEPILKRVTWPCEASSEPLGVGQGVDVERDDQAVLQIGADQEASWYSWSGWTEISPLSSASMPPIAAWAPSTVV